MTAIRDLEYSRGGWRVSTEADLSLIPAVFGDEAYIIDTATWKKFNGSAWGALGGADSLIHQASITLDNDEIIALKTSIVAITGDPGATRFLVFRGALFIADARAGAYTMSGNYRIGVEYDSSLGSSSMIGGASVFEDAAEAYPLLRDGQAQRVVATLGSWFVRGGDGSNLDEPGEVLNLGFVLFTPDIATTISGGHANNTLVACIEFRVFDLAVGRFLTTTESGWDEDTRTFG